jgi:hypothetical protein
MKSLAEETLMLSAHQVHAAQEEYKRRSGAFLAGVCNPKTCEADGA